MRYALIHKPKNIESGPFPNLDMLDKPFERILMGAAHPGGAFMRTGLLEFPFDSRIPYD